MGAWHEVVPWGSLLVLGNTGASRVGCGLSTSSHPQGLPWRTEASSAADWRKHHTEGAACPTSTSLGFGGGPGGSGPSGWEDWGDTWKGERRGSGSRTDTSQLKAIQAHGCFQLLPPQELSPAPPHMPPHILPRALSGFPGAIRFFVTRTGLMRARQLSCAGLGHRAGSGWLGLYPSRKTFHRQ